MKVSGLTPVTPAVGNGKGFQDWISSPSKVLSLATDHTVQRAVGVMQNTRARDDRPFLVMFLDPKST